MIVKFVKLSLMLKKIPYNTIGDLVATGRIERPWTWFMRPVGNQHPHRDINDTIIY